LDFYIDLEGDVHQACYDFTEKKKQGLGVLGDAFHFIVNPAKRLCDKIDCGLGIAPFMIRLATFSLGAIMIICNHHPSLQTLER